MRELFTVLVAISTFGFAGCGDNHDRLRERAQIEAQENATKNFEAEQEFRQKRAGEMEKDLKRRIRFIQAISGTFEGHFSREGVKMAQMNMTISASLPAF